MQADSAVVVAPLIRSPPVVETQVDRLGVREVVSGVRVVVVRQRERQRLVEPDAGTVAALGASVAVQHDLCVVAGEETDDGSHVSLRPPHPQRVEKRLIGVTVVVDVTGEHMPITCVWPRFVDEFTARQDLEGHVTTCIHSSLSRSKTTSPSMATGALPGVR